jgi:hypothetical protein
MSDLWGSALFLSGHRAPTPRLALKMSAPARLQIADTFSLCISCIEDCDLPIKTAGCAKSHNATGRILPSKTGPILPSATAQ